MNRLLLALSLCLALLLLPAAVAGGREAPPPDEVPCAAGWDDECDGEDDGFDEEDAVSGGGEDDDLDPCASEDETEEPGEDEESWDEPGGEDPVGEPELEEEADPGYRDFCAAPIFERGFLRRDLRITGAASGLSGGVLTLSDAAIARLPQRFREQAEQLAGLDLAVVVGRKTKLSRGRQARGAKRRGERRVDRDALRRARRVKVEGKLLPPGRWRRDADGRRVPTISAKRVTVLR